MTDLTSEYADT